MRDKKLAGDIRFAPGVLLHKGLSRDSEVLHRPYHRAEASLPFGRGSVIASHSGSTPLRPYGEAAESAQALEGGCGCVLRHGEY